MPVISIRNLGIRCRKAEGDELFDSGINMGPRLLVEDHRVIRVKIKNPRHESWST